MPKMSIFTKMGCLCGESNAKDVVEDSHHSPPEDVPPNVLLSSKDETSQRISRSRSVEEHKDNDCSIDLRPEIESAPRPSPTKSTTLGLGIMRVATPPESVTSESNEGGMGEDEDEEVSHQPEEALGESFMQSRESSRHNSFSIMTPDDFESWKTTCVSCVLDMSRLERLLNKQQERFGTDMFASLVIEHRHNIEVLITEGYLFEEAALHLFNAQRGLVLPEPGKLYVKKEKKHRSADMAGATLYFNETREHFFATMSEPDQLRMTLLLSQQEEQYGCNMFDSTTPSDHLLIQDVHRHGGKAFDIICQELFWSRYGGGVSGSQSVSPPATPSQPILPTTLLNSRQSSANMSPQTSFFMQPSLNYVPSQPMMMNMMYTPGASGNTSLVNAAGAYAFVDPSTGVTYTQITPVGNPVYLPVMPVPPYGTSPGSAHHRHVSSKHRHREEIVGHRDEYRRQSSGRHNHNHHYDDDRTYHSASRSHHTSHRDSSPHSHHPHSHHNSSSRRHSTSSSTAHMRRPSFERSHSSSSHNGRHSHSPSPALSRNNSNNSSGNGNVHSTSQYNRSGSQDMALSSSSSLSRSNSHNASPSASQYLIHSNNSTSEYVAATSASSTPARSMSNSRPNSHGSTNNMASSAQNGNAATGTSGGSTSGASGLPPRPLSTSHNTSFNNNNNTSSNALVHSLSISNNGGGSIAVEI